MSRVCVVVPVRDRPSLTRRCVDALLDAYGERDDVEVVVVDDGSAPPTAELLAQYDNRIRVVRRASSHGFAAACNAGAAAVTGTYVVFLNNDTMGTPGWLDALAQHADELPGAVAVGAKLLHPNDTIQHAGIVICHDGLPRHAYRGFPHDHPAVNRARGVRAVTAACLLVRRDAFNDCGGFDAAYVNGFEDVDLCLRLASLGEVRYCPDSVLYHLEAATRGYSADQFERNAALYRERWSHIAPDDLARYMADGLFDVRYSDVYPLSFAIAPEIGAPTSVAPSAAYRLLATRSRQVFDLLKENTALRVRLGEIELETIPGAFNGDLDLDTFTRARLRREARAQADQSSD